MVAAVAGSHWRMFSMVASENTTPQPKVSYGLLRSTTVMSCAGSCIFINRPKYRPAGPPPIQTIFMLTPNALCLARWAQFMGQYFISKVFIFRGNPGQWHAPNWPLLQCTNRLQVRARDRYFLKRLRKRERLVQQGLGSFSAAVAPRAGPCSSAGSRCKTPHFGA